MKANLQPTYINNHLESLYYQLDKEHYESLMEILKAYNPLTGPIQKVVTYFGAGGGIPTHIGHSEYYDMDHIFREITGITSLNTGVRGTLFAGGKGLTLADMIVGSIAETIERVLGALAYFDSAEEIIYGTYRTLTSQGFNCLSPQELPLFSEEQYKQSNFIYKPFTENSILGWLKGTRLISGKTVYVPSQLLLLFYSLHPKEDLIGYATSGGLDTHINEDEAISHGICELVERDAVNLRWECKIPLTKIKINIDNLSSIALINWLEAGNKFPSKVNLYYHSLDIREISVVTAIEIDRWFKRYAYYPGGGADVNIEATLIKAVNEFTQAERNLKLALLAPERSLAHAVTNMFDIGPDDPASKINIFFKVVAYYGYEKNIGKLKWYLEDGDEIPLSSIPSVNPKSSKDRCKHILEIMKKHQIDPIFFDFTPSYFQKIKLVKIFIPELTQPFLPSNPFLGHPRFYEIPKKLGYTSKKLTFEDLEKNPLPYP